MEPIFIHVKNLRLVFIPDLTCKGLKIGLKLGEHSKIAQH
jgi:hypothetical protein